MAIKDLYPSVHPTLDLNFAGTRTVDPRITFSRASTATYFDEFGVMHTAPANTPRIGFDPATGECKGLLVEEQRTNLLTYSEQFDHAYWVKTDVTVNTNAVVAPDGTLSGDKMVENTNDGPHLFSQTLAASASTTYTWSVYLKAAERFSGRLRISDNTVFLGNLVFNLTTATVTTTGSVTSPSIVSVGNDWYRVSCVAPLSAEATSTSFRCFLYNETNTDAYTGDGISGIYIWGAQLEAGAFLTSYIKTEASQVTRAADSAVMTGGNFSSWNNTTGTLLAKYSNSGWRHNNTPPSTQLDLAKYIQDYSTSIVSDSTKRVMFYPRQLTDAQIAALKG